MRLKLTLVLLLLNAALFCTLYYLDKSADSERVFNEQRTLVLTPGTVEEADALEIEGVDMPRWRIHKQGDSWRLQEPVDWSANRYAVESILMHLKFMRWETRFSVDELERSGRSLADYGLEVPKVVLRIFRGKETLELRLGAPTEIGNRLYVLAPDGDDVFVVGRDVLRAVSLSLDELRSGAIFTVQPYQVRSLGVHSPSGVRVRLVKRDERQWDFESPIRVSANATAVESLLAELLGSGVEAFMPPDLARQGLVTPRSRVVIETNDTRQTLLLGDVVPTSGNLVFAKLEDADAVFAVKRGLGERLERAQEALRERRFLRFQPDALTEIQVSMSDVSVTLQKLETGQWQVLRQQAGVGLQSWPADAGVVGSLVEALLQLEALRFVSDAPAAGDLQAFGFPNPQRRVVLKGDNEVRTLLLGDMIPAQHTVYAKRATEPYVYEVSSRILDLLRPSPLFYRLRNVQELPKAAQVRAIRLVHVPTGNVVMEETPAATADWQAHLKDMDPEQALALGRMLTFARNGRIRNYVSNTFGETMPLDAQDSLPWIWRLEADVDLPGGAGGPQEQRVQYFLTERVGGTTQFGGSPEAGVTFTLTQELIDSIHHFTFNRPEPSPLELPSLQSETVPPPSQDENTTEQPSNGAEEG